MKTKFFPTGVGIKLMLMLMPLQVTIEGDFLRDTVQTIFGYIEIYKIFPIKR